MLTSDEFKAMLERYVTGSSPAAERHLLEQWLAQLAKPSPPPELAAEELAQVRAAMWQRIADATKEEGQ